MGISDEWWLGGWIPSRRSGRPAEELLERTRTRLWVLTVVFFGVGDLVTTHVGLSIEGVVEVGPVVAPVLLEHGTAGMVGLKGATVTLFYGIYRLLPEPQSYGVPLGLAIVGVVVTIWNTLVVCISVL